MPEDKTEEKDPIKKRKSRIETEQKILSAALSVFSQQGYDAASIQAIASQANVNSALIIRYFGSKVGLLKAIMIEGCELNKSRYSCMPRLDSLADEIERYFMHEIAIDYEHCQFIRLVFMRAISNPEIVELTKQLHQTYGRQDLIDCLQPFQARGQIPKELNLNDLSMILNEYSKGIGFDVHIMQSSDRESLERRAKLAARTLAQGLEYAAEQERSITPKNS